MQSDEVRRGYAARGFCMFSPWIDNAYIYSNLQLNMGSNFISKLEIVSSLNVLNLGRAYFYYASSNRTKKYNPKVYLGAVQNVAYTWNTDEDSARKNLGQGVEKSGSCFNNIALFFLLFYK